MSISLKAFKSSAMAVLDEYEKSGKDLKFNAWIYGPKAAGKTTLLGTLPKPVWIDSFDPQGLLPLKDLIEKGEVIPNTVFERDDPKHPEAFAKWLKSFNKMRKDKIFDHLGSYCIDSMTTMSDCIMNDVIKNQILTRSNRTKWGPAHQDDWPIQMVLLQRIFRLVAMLPCHSVITGHESYEKDEKTKALTRKTAEITGKLKVKIPNLVSEFYYLEAEMDEKGGFKQTLTTQRTKKFQAASRLANKGKAIPRFVDNPDLTKLIKAAGLDYKNKPLLSEIE